MSRLPPRLQALWPVVKRGHRVGARVVGAVGRQTIGPQRGLPTQGVASPYDVLRAEPGTTRIHVTGPAFVAERPQPPGDPDAHPFFAGLLRHPVPERHVVELDGGLVLGRHAAVVSAGGRLDVETNHYFGTSGWREHPVFWNPWPARAEDIDGTVAVLATRGTGHNFFHFITDALPRLGILRDAFPGERPDAWLVDHNARYQRDLLGMLGLDDRARLIEPRPRLALRARRLLVPSLPNASTIATPESTTWLRENLPPKDAAGCPERIYVTRGSTPNTRRVEREEEILERLSARGFVSLDPATLSIQDQIDHFAAARVVVAPHGAALTSLSFCRPGVRVLEMFAPRYLNGAYWSIATNIPDARYRYLLANHPGDQPAVVGPEGFMDDIAVRPEQVDDALDRLLEDD